MRLDRRSSTQWRRGTTRLLAESATHFSAQLASFNERYTIRYGPPHFDAETAYMHSAAPWHLQEIASWVVTASTNVPEEFRCVTADPDFPGSAAFVVDFLMLEEPVRGARGCPVGC